MAKPETKWEFASLKWIHEVREAHYRATKNLPLSDWLKPVNPRAAAAACRRQGLKVKVSAPRTRGRERVE